MFLLEFGIYRLHLSSKAISLLILWIFQELSTNWKMLNVHENEISSLTCKQEEGPKIWRTSKLPLEVANFQNVIGRLLLGYLLLGRLLLGNLL